MYDEWKLSLYSITRLGRRAQLKLADMGLNGAVHDELCGLICISISQQITRFGDSR